MDFSGAAHAGEKIWIASGGVEGDVLRIENCYPASALPNSGRERNRCLTALRAFIAEQKAAAFGLDFPFGLPKALVKEESWQDFVLTFPAAYWSPEQFRCACRDATGGSELKRLTDTENHTPFSPYNLRLYRQTYFGICEVLRPLVRDDLVCLLPMQGAEPDKPWILEVCPAVALKRRNLYLSYKGKTDKHQAARVRILEALEANGGLSIPEGLRATALNDSKADALDSLIAAWATLQALRNPPCPAHEKQDVYMVEGYVYG